MTAEQAMSNAQLLGAILIDNTDLPQRITDYLESSARMPSVDELTRIRGVGPSRARQVLAAMELSARYMVGTKADKVCAPEDALPRLAYLKYEPQEHMVVLTLDAGNHILNVHDVTKGLINTTEVHAREVFAKAIEDRAYCVILAHNHPSGSTEPSAEDIALTRSLNAAGKLLQIPVLDHLVISQSGFSSMRKTHEYLFDRII